MDIDLDAPIDVLADYISEHLPWLATRPTLVALLVVGVPIFLFILVQCLSRGRRRTNRPP